MDKQDLVARLQRQKQQLEQELVDRIVQISTSIQANGGTDITRPSLPPSNPFKGVPTPRIDPDIYITIACRLIDNRSNTRAPGIRGEPLVKELNLCI